MQWSKLWTLIHCFIESLIHLNGSLTQWLNDAMTQ
jgi:hypothetical protein